MNDNHQRRDPELDNATQKVHPKENANFCQVP